jgi:hypothetical protein
MNSRYRSPVPVRLMPDYAGPRPLVDRLMHIFVECDGRETPCAGPGKCRECIRESDWGAQHLSHLITKE